jgi:TRAP-type C4-dicarboxylate transport system substrate-binding protein
MGGEGEMVRKMRVKQLQSGLLTVAGLEQIDPGVTALQNLPLVFRDLEEVAVVRTALQAEMERRFEAKGFVMLFLGDIGFVRFFSKQPMRTPEDLRKTKLFTQAGNTAQVDLMKSLGLAPQPLEPADVYTSLQTGLIDCAPMIPFYAQVSQIYKSAPHMLEMDWAPLVGGCVILKEVFDSYPPALQAAMRASAKQAGDEIQARNRTENEEAVRAMQANGLKLVRPSDAELLQWRAFLEPVYPQLRGKQVPADLYDLVMKTLESHRTAKAGAK